MNYGEIINTGYDPTKNHIYDSFVEYFDNPMLVKIKNVEGFSMYMVKIHAMLGNAYRYLVLLVDQDFEPIGASKKMEEFEWVSLQTRTLEELHRIPVHRYKAVMKKPLDQKIQVFNRTKERSVYKADDFPLDITLLHTRKDHLHQYNPTGSIVTALETFQTIINFNVKS